MFLGHGLVAFAVVAVVGRRADWPRERVIALAALAFAFATLPDVDVVYALGGLTSGVTGPFAAANAFWATSTLVHRTVTHSLVVGTVAALGFAGWHAAGSLSSVRHWTAGRVLVAAPFGLFVAAGAVVTSPLAAAILALFSVTGLAFTSYAGRRLPWLGSRAVAGTALLGLLTHPFGDLFTGEPPAMLYPLDVALVTERVTLHPDPTLHLLGAFGIELLTVWIAAAAFLRLRGERLRAHVSPRAAVGIGYAGAAVALPAPTLDVSYHFVFSILAVGTIGPIEFRRLGRPTGVGGGAGADERSGLWLPAALGIADRATALVTALTAVSVAAVGYTGAYLLL
jgi:hypothetical protein